MAPIESKQSAEDVAPAADQEEHGPDCSPDEVLAQLEARPKTSRGYAEANLTESLRSQKQVVTALLGRKGMAPEDDSLARQDQLLAQWLRSCYLQASALPALCTGNLSSLALPVAGAGLLAPFILEIFADGRINPGLPTAPDVVCDNVSELLRLAGGAIVCYQHYLAKPSSPDCVPSDDAALLLVSIAIKSLKSAEVCSSADAAMKELLKSDAEEIIPAGMEDCPAYAAFGTSQILWLMHLMRSELSGYCADVHYVMEDKEKHKDNTIARMQDNLFLLKAVPSNLQGYLRYCRNCLEFQQTKAAHIFSTKALVIADKLHDDVFKSHLLLVQATSLALGAQGERFSLMEVVSLESGAKAAMDATSEWLPQAYSRLTTRSLEPEATIIAENVIQLYQSAAEDGVPALMALYTMPPPTSLPPGALTSLPDDEVIPEGDEEGPDVSENQNVAGEKGGAGSKASKK